MCLPTWLSSPSCVRNSLGQCWHLILRSALCRHWWRSRVAAAIKVLLQHEQEKFRSPRECVSMCLFKWFVVFNATLHTSHLYGRWSVCTRIMCFRRVACVFTNVPHTSHLHDFSSEWVNMCWFKLIRITPQIGHICGSSVSFVTFLIPLLLRFIDLRNFTMLRFSSSDILFVICIQLGRDDIRAVVSKFLDTKLRKSLFNSSASISFLGCSESNKCGCSSIFSAPSKIVWSSPRQTGDSYRNTKTHWTYRSSEYARILFTLTRNFSVFNEKCSLFICNKMHTDSWHFRRKEKLFHSWVVHSLHIQCGSPSSCFIWSA